MKIVVFYHCVFVIDGKPLWSAINVVHEQMKMFKESGLEDAANEIIVGINGGKESEVYAQQFLPKKAQIVYHGLQCRNENRTLLMMEDWCRDRKFDAACLYFHSKGATHAIDTGYEKNMATPWRNRMMRHCVVDWRRCVLDLNTHEAVGCHWLTEQGWDKSQHYFAGTFFWVRALFFRTIPSLATRQRIKDSGIDSIDSRYEAEVHLGNGPRLPIVKNLYPGPIGT